MGRMMSSECRECGETVPLLAPACERCGARNPARLLAIAIAAVVVILVVAAAGAIYLAPPPQRPAVAASSPISPPAATADGDFDWLLSAMKACDELAARETGNLHFLVIPLTAQSKDIPDWRLLAKGSIGNAFTIPGDDALGGLRGGTLEIYPDEYVFSIQDASTSVITPWPASVGVHSFSTAKTNEVQSFRLQLQPRQKANASDWGSIYGVQKGNCDWVAAIVAN